VRIKLSIYIAGFCLLYQAAAVAEALPTPLTLEKALEVAEQHPAIKLSESQLEASRADAAAIEAESGLKITAEGYLTWIEPADIAIRRGNNDSKAILSASKRLYDFGYSASREEAASETVKSRELFNIDQRMKHLIEVMEMFYTVLIADKDYVLKNEEMTMAFLDYDKARDRHELGTVSDVDLLGLETAYRELLQERKLVEQQQRLSRIQLASLMNRPEELPSRLLKPEVDWKKPLPDLETVIDEALANNAALQAAQSALAAAQQQAKASEYAGNPVIRGEMTLGEYERETASTHKASAGLVLEVPLYTGGSVAAEKAKANAMVMEKQAQLRAMELSIRKQAAEQLFLLESMKADLEALQISEEYGELYLDKNRALYELEVASDFGDAVVRVSQVILNMLRSELNYALAEARLAALMGKDNLKLEMTSSDTTN
jgi:outer membrane protein TolC